ncbi:MAG: DUF1015 domain-containing protein [Treponema sp.]|jgi:hypothetical protein|nr:DUF1015 domain-containing protein [Treponema sp.]
MNSIPERLAALGVGIPEILLPRPGIDLEKWAVIACDQFTQDRAYWEKVKAWAGTSPSTLNLVFPELYLEDPAGKEARIQVIRRSMREYLEEGVFDPLRRCMVYVERSTPWHPLRQGLVLALDLERYDWAPRARLLARATEGTVKERLPPRMDIRRDALLETPHILLLMDDEEGAILPGLAEKATTLLYDTPLMMNSGSVKGWALEGKGGWTLLAESLERLAGEASSRYGTEDAYPFLFAAGDGNHSLAAAKGIWEEYKQAHRGGNLENHPARWVLVELENLYDPGISFEPIHRAIFGASRDGVLEALSGLPDFSIRPAGADGTRGKEELIRVIKETGTRGNRLGFIAPEKGGLSLSLIETSASGIATACLQPLLDEFIRTHTGVSIDYIHGEEEIFRLAASPARPALGLLLPPIQKKSLFMTTAKTGPLPRKSFSMGLAEEKRFYLECRKLFG